MEVINLNQFTTDEVADRYVLNEEEVVQQQEKLDARQRRSYLNQRKLLQEELNKRAINEVRNNFDNYIPSVSWYIDPFGFDEITIKLKRKI